MTSNSNQTPDEKKADIERQIAELLAEGYQRDDLWVNSSGHVIVDPDALALEAYRKVFHKDKQ